MNSSVLNLWILYLCCTSKCRPVPIDRVWLLSGSSLSGQSGLFLRAQIVFELALHRRRLKSKRVQPTLFLEPPTRLNLNLNQNVLVKIAQFFSQNCKKIFVKLAKYICRNCKKVSVKIAECICQNCQINLSKLQNVFVKTVKCICQNCKMH